MQANTKNAKTPGNFSIPKYRLRTGYNQAIVTLRDAQTRRAKDYWLGEYGSPESHEAYNRVIAMWFKNERRLPPPELVTAADREQRLLTVKEVLLAYWQHAQATCNLPMQAHVRALIRLTRRLYGSTPASTFGPKSLILVREAMIKGDPKADPPRKPWSRKYINAQVHRLCGIFQWAAAQEMIPASVCQQLRTITALRRGKSEAIETDPVEPVAVDLVDAVRPFVSRQVEALIDLQLLSGARSGELLLLRPKDIQKDEKTGIWSVNLTEHKTAHHGHARTLFIGPRAQKVLEPFLQGRSNDAFLFSPAEAHAEWRAKRARDRKTPASCGNQPGSNRVDAPLKKPGEHYTSGSYRKAIQSACDRAFPVPKDMSLEEAREWRANHRWHPHQLRHNAATLIRREFGLEAARVVLGHPSALLTESDLPSMVPLASQTIDPAISTP